jgi:hypothetical protein
MQYSSYMAYSAVRSESLVFTAVCSHSGWNLQGLFRCSSVAPIATQHTDNIPLPLDCRCIVAKQHNMNVQEDRRYYRTPEDTAPLKLYKLTRELYKAGYNFLSMGDRQVCLPAS